MRMAIDSDCLNRFIAGITIGDVAGIGPEVVVRSLSHKLPFNALPLIMGHPVVLNEAAYLAGCPENFVELKTIPSSKAELVSVLCEFRDRAEFACWNPAGDAVQSAPKCHVSAIAGDAAFQYLIHAIDLARGELIDAIVTAPLNKESLHLAGHRYPGHTEILAERCRVHEFAMMLYLSESALAPWRSLVQPEYRPFASADGLSIAHVTLHTSVASVPGLLSVDNVSETIQLMDEFLKRIGNARRSIAVAALNPHGGENGLFGDEERRIILPAVQKCEGIVANVIGPLPVDTLIRRAVVGEFDGVVAMYHDQGHIPIKLIGFDAAVNITLGLPIIRTSPTHGTAFDRAWNTATPANASGMTEAIHTALRLAAARLTPARPLTE
jgi:4-hydroxythreonine-4-phosphate dehydrogenase